MQREIEQSLSGLYFLPIVVVELIDIYKII